MRTLPLVSAAIILASGPNATEPTPETRRWWNHVRVLADDGMEGREPAAKDTSAPRATW